MLYMSTRSQRIQPTVKMGQKSILCSQIRAIILCIYYIIFVSALPGTEVYPDSNLRPNKSSLSAGPPEVAKKDYVVWPNEPGNISMASYIGRAIETIVSRDCITPFTSLRTGIEFWVVTATALQAQYLSHIRYVSVCREHKTKLRPLI